MSSRVFISYRHTDSQHVAGRLNDKLVDAFGEPNVFFDVYSIELGADFRTTIRDTVRAVDAVVVVIGPTYISDRLTQEDDWVRFEVAEAIRQEKLLVPVLIDDARMPTPGELPHELEALSYRNAAKLRADPDFGHDVTRLINTIGRAAQRVVPDTPTADPTSGDVAVRVLDRRHNKRVRAIAFAPDGRALASGSADKTIKIWDVATGDEIRTLAGHSKSVEAIAYLPDGRTLASASFDSTVKLWDVATGQQLRSLNFDTLGFASIAVSPDGRSLACGGINGTVLVWDVMTGDRTRAFAIPNNSIGGAVWSVAFSADGASLAAGSGDNSVRLWDIANSSVIRTLNGHTDRVATVAFGRDGATLASGSGDKTVRIWDVVTGIQTRILSGHTAPVVSVAFSPDGATLASSSAKTVRMWDAASGNLLRSLPGHRNLVSAVAFSPDGSLLATGGGGASPIGRGDNQLRLWQLGRP